MSNALLYTNGRTKTNRRRGEPIIDGLPEFYHYVDDGCEVSPRCLECLLHQCKYDDPEAYHRGQRCRRDQEVVLARQAEGASIPQLAQRFGLSQRTIHRIFARAAEGRELGIGNGANGTHPATPSHQRSQDKILNGWRNS